MHELSYVLKIIDLSTGVAAENGINKVKEISVEAGAMTGVLPEYLNMYFKKASINTILEDAVLNVKIIPVLAECECGNNYTPSKENGYSCPECGSHNGKIIGGRDIEVVQVKGI